MKMKMHKCKKCNIYTIQDKCPKCGGNLNVIYPPKYSIEDKYGKYRRKLKEESKMEVKHAKK
ncbi:RNA-protein complex protein Nop10 [uncultured Methanobrevibacter sp.]|uniref:RNA-protein complex protein Nop10 n=1 Tax=uncultured Methanobrevibacter sp. TaxID=253161 RepID=UPI0025FF9F4A|nr:RNA-protein complex protein Nop10 [uncultured Methanobrevibacter sp.]